VGGEPITKPTPTPCTRYCGCKRPIPTLQRVLAASDPPLFLGILGAVVLVLGFVAVGALAVYVLKRAPKDGSDIGRDPRVNPDEHKHPDGGSQQPRRP
jgi:hypothetical protein